MQQPRVYFNQIENFYEKRRLDQKKFQEKIKEMLTLPDFIKYKHLEWLFNPYNKRGEGRTTLLALAYISNAIRYPDVPIICYDHNPERGCRGLYEYIRQFIYDYDLKMTVHWEGGKIILIGSKCSKEDSVQLLKNHGIIQ